jgi:hypothetical protein
MQTVEQQWLAANPSGAVWLLFHDVFQSFSTTIPGGANEILPWWNSSGTKTQLVIGGHIDNIGKQFYQQPFGGHATLISVDYQDSSHGTYAVFRVTATGHVDGCAYSVLSASWLGTNDCSGPGYVNTNTTGSAPAGFDLPGWSRESLPIRSPVRR